MTEMGRVQVHGGGGAVHSELDPWWLSRNGETEVRLYVGHVLDVLGCLPPATANLVMTSPPYWGLRDYGPDTAAVWGGDPACPHDWRDASVTRKGSTNGRPDLGSTLASAGSPQTLGPGAANDAGATRVRRGAAGASARRRVLRQPGRHLLRFVG